MHDVGTGTLPVVTRTKLANAVVTRTKLANAKGSSIYNCDQEFCTLLGRVGDVVMLGYTDTSWLFSERGVCTTRTHTRTPTPTPTNAHPQTHIHTHTRKRTHPQTDVFSFLFVEKKMKVKAIPGVTEKIALLLFGKWLVPTLPFKEQFLRTEADAVLAAVEKMPVALIGGCRTWSAMEEALGT